ncbi:MAG TPA: hypothetical protein VJG32_22035 [Anaerolineae bacterium]|nr:hypothetical protein [Anaerolineae bacterium]
MMPITGSSLFSGLVGVVVIVAILALVAGAALSGNDLLNPNTSDAKAQEKNQATQSRSEKDEIDLEAYRTQKAVEAEKMNLDLENYKAIQVAHTQAEQDKFRLEVEAQKQEFDQALVHQQEQAELDIAFARLARYILLGVGALAISVVSVGLTACLIRFSRSRWAPAQTPTAHADIWSDPIWRAEQIRLARAQEVAQRQTALVREVAIQGSSSDGNGRYPR